MDATGVILKRIIQRCLVMVVRKMSDVKLMVWPNWKVLNVFLKLSFYYNAKLPDWMKVLYPLTIVYGTDYNNPFCTVRSHNLHVNQNAKKFEYKVCHTNNSYWPE